MKTPRRCWAVAGVPLALVAGLSGAPPAGAIGNYPGITSSGLSAQVEQQVQEWMAIPVSSSAAKGPASSSTWNLTALPGTKAYAGMSMPRQVQVLNAQGPVVVAGVADFDDSTPGFPADDTLVIDAPQGITFLPGPATSLPVPPSSSTMALPPIIYRLYGFIARYRTVMMGTPYSRVPNVNLVNPNFRLSTVRVNLQDSTWVGSTRGSWLASTFVGSFRSGGLVSQNFRGVRAIYLYMNGAVISGCDFSPASATSTRPVRMDLWMVDSSIVGRDSQSPGGEATTTKTTFANRVVEGNLTMSDRTGQSALRDVDFSNSQWDGKLTLNQTGTDRVTFDGLRTTQGLLFDGGTVSSSTFKNLRTGKAIFEGVRISTADFTGTQAENWTPRFFKSRNSLTVLDTVTFDMSSFDGMTGSVVFGSARFRGVTINGVDMSNDLHAKFIRDVLQQKANGFLISRATPGARGLTVRAGSDGPGTTYVVGNAAASRGKIYEVLSPVGGQPMKWQEIDPQTFQPVEGVDPVTENPVANDGP